MKILKKYKNFLLTIVGAAITGMGVGFFLSPFNIVGGGATGIGTILYNTPLRIPISFSFMIVNLVFLLMGVRIFKKDFVIKTLIGAGLVSLFSELFLFLYNSFIVNTGIIPQGQTLLVAIFGSVFYGVGIGICFVSGASSGGTDILGRIIQHRFPHMPIGKLLLIVDSTIILASSIVSFLNRQPIGMLYGILALFISSFTVDFVINTFNQSNMVFVITDKGDEIAKKLVDSSPRGVTLIDAVGAYTHSDKKVLFCVMKGREQDLFQKRILEIDPRAFIVYAESQKIKGNGFYLYK